MKTLRTLLIPALFLAFFPISQAPAEVVTTAVTLDLQEDWRLQLRTLGEQIDQKREYFGRTSVEDYYDPQAAILDSDKTPVDVVLRRTEALLDLLKGQFQIDLASERQALEQLKTQARDLPVAEMKYVQRAKDEKGPYRLGEVTNEAVLFPVFAEAKALQRAVSLKNPLLDFDQIAFVTRYPTAMGHMCDEWYGRVSEPGGGLYLLNNPFLENATVTDLVSQNPVQQGASAGEILKPGAFVTPELDYDAQTLYFAYSGNDKSFFEQRFAEGADYDMRKEYFHSPETAYHIFRINIDGSNLTQLTEGTWNDFYPAVLPNGRIVFLSERRGGEGRCHPRPCPSYVMHSMLPDGSGIVPISYHEINEWSPVVTNDGRIIYSRWDYVDRSFSKGQYPWISNPDGRNVRALYGNYEGGGGSVHADLRPVPNSQLFFGTMYGHHSASWGTLVAYDSTIIDDGTRNTWKYLTPEVGPYNHRSHRGAFATPYPLSKDFFLCVYSPDATHFSLNGASQTYEYPPTPHGIYVVDRFGNKTLLYRDDNVPANLPYPVRERPRPVVIPDGTPVAPAPGQPAPEPAQIAETATVVLLNVYDSLLPFPEDMKVKALRIVQVLPKSTPNAGSPPIAYDSEYVARQVLGTVPVEEDGSAHFTMPAKVPVFFQALDEKGLAIQSMRSSAYALPAETMSCVGCHEPKGQAPKGADYQSLTALQRPPSPILPGPDGSRPFSFARLVQPVLDARCVSCHKENADAPDLHVDGEPWPEMLKMARENKARYDNRAWSVPYQNLGPFAFYYNTRRNQMGWGGEDPGKGYRSVPGKVGARVSPLMTVLTTGVHQEKLQMTPAEWDRIITWLDMGSPYFGAYDNTREQTAGEIVEPALQ